MAHSGIYLLQALAGWAAPGIRGYALSSGPTFALLGIPVWDPLPGFPLSGRRKGASDLQLLGQQGVPVSQTPGARRRPESRGSALSFDPTPARLWIPVEGSL